MRTLTANASTRLSINTGTEWLVILEVEWVDNGSVFYSDQAFPGCETKVVNISGFDTSMSLEGSSDSQELSVVLDDTDAAIRAIYNSHDIHKRPARIYVVEKNTALADRILVFKGELVTPIEWDEQQRSVSFNVLSKLNSVQLGFSMEEGDFPNIPDEALGKAWPLVFGEVCHIPAVKVRAPRRGFLQTGVGIHDFTLEPRICQALNIQCPSQSTGNQYTYERGTNGVISSDLQKTIGPDPECVNRRFGEICRLKDLLDQQKAYEYDQITIYNGVAFPQNKKINIFIEGATFTGVFSGNTFTISSRKHPEFDTFEHQACRTVPNLGYGSIQAVSQVGGTEGTNGWGGGLALNQIEGASIGNFFAWSPNSQGTAYRPNQTDVQAFQSCDEALTSTIGMVGGPKDSWAYYDEMEESSFFWAPEGSEVYMESESEIIFIVSLLPGVVNGVAAYRTAPNGNRYLTEVTADKYTVYETDYGGYQVVEIGMNKDLKLYNDQWDDQIYVSFTSSIGPNPCDIIEWLVEKYTDLTVDAASFASVKSALTNYPTNFYLISRPDVYDVINDIAYQSRCSVYVRNDIIYIKYLSEEPTSVRTISESDVLSGSFVEFLSETEDVYTTHNIKWQKGGAAVQDDREVEQELILKYNVNKYGTVEEEWDYYCLNIYELVLKTGTFWLIRKANSWKKAKFKLPFKHMELDVGDCITLNVQQFSSTPVKCVIESMNLDPDSYTLDVVVWSPMRSGDTTPYYWAWPAGQSCSAIWPLSGDSNGGGGYSFDVTPPIGHILLGGARRDDQRIISSGDLHPSDLCDTLPTVFCELSDYINFDEVTPEILAKQIAQSAARQAMENGISGGGNAGGSSEEKKGTDNCGDGFGCNYKVNVIWHTSTLQGQAGIMGGPKCGGPCKPLGGCPSCAGPVWTVCHTYGAPWAAKMAADYWEASGKETCCDHWDNLETRVVDTQVADGEFEGPFASDCQSVQSAEAVDPGDGTSAAETSEATGKTGNEVDPKTEEGQAQILEWDAASQTWESIII